VSVEPLLKLQHFSVKFNSPQCRLPSLERETNAPLCLKQDFSYHLPYRLLRHHSIRFCLPLCNFIAVETVVAVHIAETGSRFDQYCLKRHHFPSHFAHTVCSRLTYSGLSSHMHAVSCP